jgi:hypothetical protein
MRVIMFPYCLELFSIVTFYISMFRSTAIADAFIIASLIAKAWRFFPENVVDQPAS